MKTVLKFIALSLSASTAVAMDVSYGMGEHTMGGKFTKQQACVLAENKAIENALFNFSGKEFEANQETFCVDTKSHAYCNYVKEITMLTAGSITAVLDRVQRTDKDTCYVEVKAEVQKARQLAAQATSKRIYFPGDNIDVKINTGEPLYLYIFNLHRKGVDVLFPNQYNNNNLIDDRFVFPGKDISVVASLDKNETISNETLLFLFTKRRQDIDPRDVNKDNLRDLLKSIPNFEKRLIQHNFIIKRSDK